MARSWTQARFAEVAGFTVKYLQRIEAGGANLSVKSLVTLANLLGVTVADLFAKPAKAPSPRGRPKRRA